MTRFSFHYGRRKEEEKTRGHSWAYDAASNLTNLIDSVGNKTTFVYDDVDRLAQRIDPLGAGTSYA